MFPMCNTRTIFWSVFFLSFIDAIKTKRKLSPPAASTRTHGKNGGVLTPDRPHQSASLTKAVAATAPALKDSYPPANALSTVPIFADFVTQEVTGTSQTFDGGFEEDYVSTITFIHDDEVSTLSKPKHHVLKLGVWQDHETPVLNTGGLYIEDEYRTIDNSFYPPNDPRKLHVTGIRTGNAPEITLERNDDGLRPDEPATTQRFRINFANDEYSLVEVDLAEAKQMFDAGELRVVKVTRNPAPDSTGSKWDYGGQISRRTSKSSTSSRNTNAKRR